MRRGRLKGSGFSLIISSTVMCIGCCTRETGASQLVRQVQTRHKTHGSKLARVRRRHLCEVLINPELSMCCCRKPARRRGHYHGHVLTSPTEGHRIRELPKTSRSSDIPGITAKSTRRICAIAKLPRDTILCVEDFSNANGIKLLRFVVW